MKKIKITDGTRLEFTSRIVGRLAGENTYATVDEIYATTAFLLEAGGDAKKAEDRKAARKTWKALVAEGKLTAVWNMIAKHNN